jgi:tetratricopeptide (TPR) repeat protein
VAEEALAAAELAKEQDDSFKRLIAILIATVTIIAAVAAFLQTDTGGRAVKANRDAQRFAIEALGIRAAGQSQVEYGYYSAVSQWYAVNDYLSLAEGRGDTEAAARYQAVRDKLVPLTPLLDSDGMTSYARFEVSAYLERGTELSQRSTEAARLNNEWNAKANTYVVHLTLLAVSLALYGLSTTVEDWTRWLFVGAGSLIVVTTLIWMAVTVIVPVRALPEQAILSYAKGVGQAWSGDTEDAIVTFDETIELAPEYAEAYSDRGSAHYSLGGIKLGMDPTGAQEELRKAAADYESARAYGKDDINVNWNLGWTYYLLGFFEESANANQRALDIDPNLFAVRCNLAITYLADGKIAESQAEYARAVEGVRLRVTEARDAGGEPPSSLFDYLDSCAIDVDNMLHRLNDQPRDWIQAPPRELIADTPEIRAEAARLITDFKSILVAFEATSELPGPRPTVNISPFEFAKSIEYEDGTEGPADERQAEFDADTTRVYVMFRHQDIAESQTTVWKIYHNNEEVIGERLEEQWSLGIGPAGAQKPIDTDDPGEYAVELYIDNNLIQRGTFIVDEAEQ